MALLRRIGASPYCIESFHLHRPFLGVQRSAVFVSDLLWQSLLSRYPNMCLELLFDSSGIGQIVHCRLDT